MKLLPIERRWTRAVLDAMFPRNASDDLPEGILDLDVDAYLDDTFNKVPTVSGLGMRAGFVAIALAPPVTILKFCTIDRLGAEDRVRVIEKLYKSPIYHVRQLVVLAKTTGAMLYCAAPASRDVMLKGMRVRRRATENPTQDTASDVVAGEVAHVPA